MYLLWRRFRWWMRATLGVLAALSTVYVVIDASRNRDNPPGYFHGHLLIPAAIVLGLSSVMGVVDGLLERMYRDRRSDIGRQVDRHLYVLHREIVRLEQSKKHRQEPSASRKTLNRVGITVWLVPGWYRSISESEARGTLPDLVANHLPKVGLWRAARVRFKDDPGPSEINWIKGLGAIGLCWDSRKVIERDLAVDWPDASLMEADWKAEFDGLDAEVRMGLTGDQAWTLRQSYAGVRAVPIRRRHESSSRATLLGCMTLDVPADAIDFDVLSRPLLGVMKQSAGRIGDQLAKLQH